MKVVAIGQTTQSGKSRLIQVAGERFAVRGDASLRVGDEVLLTERPAHVDEGGRSWPAQIWAEKAEIFPKTGGG